jgi:hypothetical protein
MVALLILQDEPHDQGDDRVSAGLSDELVLGESVLLGGGVALDRVKQPLDRAAFGPVVYVDRNGRPYALSTMKSVLSEMYLTCRISL